MEYSIFVINKINVNGAISYKLPLVLQPVFIEGLVFSQGPSGKF